MSHNSATPKSARAALTAKSAARIELAIDDLTLGPYGVGRHQGRAVLVPNAAPGDVLEITPAQSRSDYWVARLERIVAAGSVRRHAPCAYLPRCGGCDWQHIAYAEQTAAKARLIAGEFKRGLGVELDPDGLVVPAPAEFGYRSRVRVKAGADGAVGFFELGSNRLVAVDRCLVGEDLDFGPARGLAGILGPGVIEIEIVKSGERQVLIADLDRRAKPDIDRVARLMAANGAVAGVILRADGSRFVSGEAAIAIELEPGLTLRADADAFTQVNHALNRQLIAAVMELARIESGVSVLDLFCGAGNFSLPAARRGAQVMGVDADARAIYAAQRNAHELGLHDARFFALRAQTMGPFLLRAGYRPQVAVLDPPRSGARELMKTIAALGAERVVYVSCNAATLIRDLRLLTGDGYVISAVKAFDFFPNTHHCEVMAVLT